MSQEAAAKIGGTRDEVNVVEPKRRRSYENGAQQKRSRIIREEKEKEKEKEGNWKRGARFNRVAIGATSDAAPTKPSAGSEDSVRKPIPSGGLRASNAANDERIYAKEKFNREEKIDGDRRRREMLQV